MKTAKKPNPGDWVLLKGDKVIACGKDVRRLIRMFERLRSDDLVITKEPYTGSGYHAVWANERPVNRPTRPRLLQIDSPGAAVGPCTPPGSKQDPLMAFEETRRKHGRRLTIAHIEKIIEEQYEGRFRRAGLHLITPGRRTTRRRLP
jgi:hypothetical protein